MSTDRRQSWRGRLDAAIAANAANPSARHAQLATVRPDGLPANRTVVVRGMSEPVGAILVSTDVRSPKVVDLGASCWCALCWYFPETREQFRFLARVTVVDDPADSDRARIWTELPEASRRSFLGPPPGTSQPTEPETAATPLEPPDTFALLVLEPWEVDHLDLRPEPHERTLHQRIADTSAWSFKPARP